MNVGDKVRHETFGAGVVVDVYSGLVQVNFTNLGLKVVEPQELKLIILS